MDDMDINEMPAFAQAAAKSAASAPTMLSDILSDAEMELNLAGDPAEATEPAIDITPTAMDSSESSIAPIPPSADTQAIIFSTVDTQAAILELMFPQGIPASAIKKAMFVSGVIDELIAFTAGDVDSLSIISDLITKHK